MAVKVRITAKNFTYGSKVFGTNGEYTVDERTGRWIVKNAKGFVTEGVLPDEEDPALATINDAAFMAMVRRNALEIGKIVSEAYELDRIAQVDARTAEASADPGQPPAETANDNSDGATTGADTASSGSSESPSTQNASVVPVELPEDFPGREILIAAGINKVADIPSEKSELMNVTGMTARLANQIGVKLAQ